MAIVIFDEAEKQEDRSAHYKMLLRVIQLRFFAAEDGAAKLSLSPAEYKWFRDQLEEVHSR